MKYNTLLERGWFWVLLCWGSAFLFGCGWVATYFFHPDPTLLLPDKIADTLLYTAIFQKSASGFNTGDPFLWEHRYDPASVISFYHFWPAIFGFIYQIGSHPLLIVTSTLLSGLSFYSVFHICTKLGHPKPFAFFVAGIQTFFIVNLAYQISGFRTDFSLYNISKSEHSRLYPSVTAMAFYNLATFMVIWGIQRPRFLKTVLASLLVALTAYGRPFDFMVLFGALCLMVILSLLRRDLQIFSPVVIITIFACIFSLKFVFDFFQYDKLYHEAYFDQLIRGNLQVKLPVHYLKYALFCIILLGSVTLAFGKKLLGRPNTPTLQEKDETIALAVICSLAASSLLIHFKSAFEGGVTLVGIGYLFPFNILPSFFILFMHFVWFKLSPIQSSIFYSRIWIALLISMLTYQQIRMGMERIPSKSHLAVEQDARRTFDWIKANAARDPVILTLGHGPEASVMADSWIFIPNSLVGTYICSASTTELLERYLLTKLILTGTLDDIAPLFSQEGLPDVNLWVKNQNSTAQFWFERLKYCIGPNTFILHPQKNLGEFKIRKIRLPPYLLQKNDFISYFSPELHAVFERYKLLQNTSTSTLLNSTQSKFKLDYIYIPELARPHIEIDRLRNTPNLKEIKFNLTGGLLFGCVK